MGLDLKALSGIMWVQRNLGRVGWGGETILGGESGDPGLRLGLSGKVQPLCGL